MFKIEGLDKLQKELKSLAKKAKDLDGRHSVPVSELLTDSFISRHTAFSTVDEMFEASGFKVKTQEDFANIPDAGWDEYIRTNSSFDNWQSMLGASTQEWTVSKLGF